MRAYVFPGQGAQYVGMGRSLYEGSPLARDLFDRANEILGFRITDVMFEGTDEELRQTRVTQPSVFLHSVILARVWSDFRPSMVAGHSLGEFSALVSAGALDFEDGLRLVSARAEAMQLACEREASTMAAVLGLEDSEVERVCSETEGVVVAANYNCPGQVVISGSVSSVERACEGLKAAGAKRAMVLKVGGAFHSPLMEPARASLASAIESTRFSTPICPVYQNVDGRAHTDPSEIRANLVSQLTGAVRWRQTVEGMVLAGATEFVELGPGNVLQGLVKKCAPSVTAESHSEL